MKSSNHRHGSQPPRALRQARVRSTIGQTQRPLGKGGFTLIELLSTIAIALILLAVGVPSFSTIVNGNTLTVQANDLIANLSLARGQAMLRGQRVVVCKSNNAEDCSRADDTHWEDGWLMYVDADASGTYQSSEVLLRASTGLPNSNTLRTDSVFRNWIAFLPDGRSIGSSGTTPPTAGEFRLCDSRGVAVARVVEISPIGRAKVIHELGADSCP